jgi:hypothetical protein
LTCADGGASAISLIIALAAADGVALLCRGERVERLEIVHPQLNRNKAGAVQTSTQAAHNRRIHCLLSTWIFGAVLITSEIAPRT